MDGGRLETMEKNQLQIIIMLREIQSTLSSICVVVDRVVDDLDELREEIAEMQRA